MRITNFLLTATAVNTPATGDLNVQLANGLLTYGNSTTGISLPLGYKEIITQGIFKQDYVAEVLSVNTLDFGTLTNGATYTVSDGQGNILFIGTYATAIGTTLFMTSVNSALTNNSRGRYTTSLSSAVITATATTGNALASFVCSTNITVTTTTTGVAPINTPAYLLSAWGITVATNTNGYLTYEHTVTAFNTATDVGVRSGFSVFKFILVIDKDATVSSSTKYNALIAAVDYIRDGQIPAGGSANSEAISVFGN